MLTVERVKEVVIEKGNIYEEVIFIGQTGSTLFMPYESRKKDIDYFVVCKNLLEDRIKIRFLEDDIMHDIFLLDYDFFKNVLELKAGDNKIQYWNLYHTFMNVLYQKDTDDNFLFDFFKHKEQYKEVVITKLKKLGFVENFGVRFVPHYKEAAIAYITSQFLENNNMELTEEIKNAVYSLYNEEHLGLFKAVGKYFGLELDMRNIFIPKDKVFAPTKKDIHFTNIF